MKLFRKTIVTCLVLFVLFSCKKENNTDPEPTPVNLSTTSSAPSLRLAATTTTLITDLKSGTSATYLLQNAAANIAYYTDRTYLITSLPTSLSGSTLIKTAGDDKNIKTGGISFTLSTTATVYVAYDSRATSLPAWLNGWTKTNIALPVTDKASSLQLYSKSYNAGSVTLGANLASPAANVSCKYVVFVKEVAVSLVNDLKSGTSATYLLQTAAANATYYVDRTYQITSLPSALSGSTLIKTAGDDKSLRTGSLSFTLSSSATVYVAYDPRATALPAWLNGWTKTNTTVPVTDKVSSLQLYSKTYSAGPVTIGTNMASPAANVSCQYIVFAKASTTTTIPPSSLMLGVNGHSLSLKTYLSVPISLQIDMMKKMGMTVYRQDIIFNTDGSIPSWSPFDELYSASTAAGITILPMINTSSLDFNKTEAKSYETGKILGANVAAKNSRYFKYYNLGNELDNRVIKPASDGSRTTDYKEKEFKILAAYLKGMDDGIKSKQPNAQTMIDAGWLHYAFLQMLQTYGVKFDIVAYHWYSDMEGAAKGKGITDITQKLSSLFTKPIWFTEVGQRYKTSNFEQLQNEFTLAFKKKCEANPQVKSLQFYELIDQPDRVAIEGNFGFVKWDIPFVKWSYKLAAQSLFVK